MQTPYFKMPVLQSKWNVQWSVPISHFPAITKTEFSAASEAFCPEIPPTAISTWASMPSEHCSFNAISDCWAQYNLWFGGDVCAGAAGKEGILQTCLNCLHVVSLTPLGRLAVPAVFPVRKAWHNQTQSSQSQPSCWQSQVLPHCLSRTAFFSFPLMC